MGMKLLFSPLGGTDPISNTNMYDGAMLHIVRHYRIDKVYFYMSREIIQYQEADERYTYCLKKLGELQNREIQYEMIRRPELIEVQDFEIFYREFKEEIDKIRNEMGEDDELILNLSSGTPAMKSWLLVIRTMNELSCKAVQVVTPDRAMNEHRHKDYQVKELWELDPDNEEGAENRCREVPCPSLFRVRQEVNIRQLIREYDYHAARELAAELKDHEKSYMKLIQVAEKRELLDIDAVERALRTNHLDQLYSLPITEVEERDIFEYALVLQIRLRRGEYADFIRAISPILYRLFKQILEKRFRILLGNYVRWQRTGGVETKAVWDPEKLSKDVTGREIRGILNEAYEARGGFRCGDVYPVHMQRIIQTKSDDEELKELVGELREAEEKVRNLAAHQIVSVNDNTIRQWTRNHDAEWIMNKIKEAFEYAGIIDNSKKEVWNSYDKMNEVILRLMNG